MYLKPFEVGQYNDSYIALQNSGNGMQVLLTEEEFEIVKFLKENESETLLALLLPNIGIAKKKHIQLCLAVLGKLKKVGVVDYYSIIGRSPSSTTTTIDINQNSRSIDLIKFHPFFQFLFKLAHKSLGKIPAFITLSAASALALLAFLLFPFSELNNLPYNPDFSYIQFFLITFFVAQVALFFRSLLQSSFLVSLKQQPGAVKVGFFPPLLFPEEDLKAVNVLGAQSKVMLHLLGVFSPMAMAMVFVLLTKLGVVSLLTGFIQFSAAIGMAMLFSCPIFSFDAANILSVLLFPSQLGEKVSEDFKDIFHKRGALSSEMLVSLLVLFIWLLVWLDGLRGFWETFAGQIMGDLYTPESTFGWLGSILWLMFLFSMLLAPCLVFAGHAIRKRIDSKKKNIVISSKKVKDSLSFEERMVALEKIPLFTYLDDQGRLGLLNEMIPMFYKDGSFLVHQGEIGKEFYVLVKGRSIAYYQDAKGAKTTLAELAEGDAFGEIALIDDVPRTASIISNGGCIVLALQKEGFYRFAESFGSLDRVKSMIRLSSFFRRHPLISKLKARDQANLIDRFQFITLTAGDEVPGLEDDSKVYVVYSGKVRVDTGDDDSEMILDADDCFGYSNAFKAKYFAVEGTGLLAVAREDFDELIWGKLVEKPELFI